MLPVQIRHLITL
uniref:Uncharacterized protein n=1 Tax=Anguilla anguilla TaxID=7936 RepID=A0A0E9RGT3_ANGAN